MCVCIFCSSCSCWQSLSLFFSRSLKRGVAGLIYHLFTFNVCKYPNGTSYYCGCFILMLRFSVFEPYLILLFPPVKSVHTRNNQLLNNVEFIPVRLWFVVRCSSACRTFTPTADKGSRLAGRSWLAAAFKLMNCLFTITTITTHEENVLFCVTRIRVWLICRSSEILFHFVSKWIKICELKLCLFCLSVNLRVDAPMWMRCVSNHLSLSLDTLN